MNVHGLPAMGPEKIRALSRAKLERRLCRVQMRSNLFLQHAHEPRRTEVIYPALETRRNSQVSAEYAHLFRFQVGEQAFGHDKSYAGLAPQLLEYGAARGNVG